MASMYDAMCFILAKMFYIVRHAMFADMVAANHHSDMAVVPLRLRVDRGVELTNTQR